MDCSLLGVFIHAIFQLRILEWVAISYSNKTDGPHPISWRLIEQKVWPPLSKRELLCQKTAFRLHLKHGLFSVSQQTAFALELQLFPESPARQPLPSDFGITKPLQAQEPSPWKISSLCNHIILVLFLWRMRSITGGPEAILLYILCSFFKLTISSAWWIFLPLSTTRGYRETGQWLHSHAFLLDWVNVKAFEELNVLVPNSWRDTDPV